MRTTSGDARLRASGLALAVACNVAATTVGLGGGGAPAQPATPIAAARVAHANSRTRARCVVPIVVVVCMPGSSTDGVENTERGLQRGMTKVITNKASRSGGLAGCESRRSQ